MSEHGAPYPEAPVSQQLGKPVYGADSYPVWHRRATPLTSPRARAPRFEPKTILLRKGEVRRTGAMPLSCDILLDRDMAVTLRDGTVIYTDVLRPAADGRYPGIISWSPYGKEIGGCHLEDFPHRAGVPLDRTTELMKWEAADPGFWVAQGYVVLHPDNRGAYRSGGHGCFLGRQEAEDGYDYIEWAAEQPWSNGRLGLAGNSWLAMAQWTIAAERPPHLAAIAPWEGVTDLMREMALKGGIPQIPFPEAIIQLNAGNHLIEDLTKMAIVEPDDTLYWQDKAATLEKIDIPAYVVASFDNGLHGYGTFAGWRRIASREKWLRVHNSHEWPDFYHPDHVAELLLFFDRYLKGKDNGWEATPRIRTTMLDPGGPPEELLRPIDSFPPDDYRHTPLFLANAGRLTSDVEAMRASVSYRAGAGGQAEFQIQFDRDAEWLGYASLKLWVEADGSDDMDLLAVVEKRGPQGEILTRLRVVTQERLLVRNMLRVSRRALDPTRSAPADPVLLLRGEEKLAPGEIVPVEIGFWPMGLKFRKGEVLHLTISAFEQTPWHFALGGAPIQIPSVGFTFDPAAPPEMTTLGGVREMTPAWVSAQAVHFESPNRGTHHIHFGGEYDSHLLVPLKY